MIHTLTEISEWLADGRYSNEEHVRVGIVCRILMELGWDIWNPTEVNTEFAAVPSEDSTKVDIALFRDPYTPSVFIEVKFIGKLERSIERVEMQLRDYNRNNTAAISIITDGQRWRFYFSQTSGEFADKCFKTIDMLVDPLDSVADAFGSILSKEALTDGTAVSIAEDYLRLNRRQRALEDSISRARQLVLVNPFPSLPDALVQAVRERGVTVSTYEATDFIQKYSVRPTERRTESEAMRRVSPPFVRTGVRDRKKESRRSSRLPPNGTQCRFSYKNRTFLGEIRQSQVTVENLGTFGSFSAASNAATQTSRNGWLDWELLLPSSTNWILAADWRESSG